MSRIVFHKVSFQNFMSYGNYESTLDLDKNDLTLIQGNNGAGKTTSLLALSYNLFGKTFNKVVKASLINKKNKKGMLTKSWFSVGDDNYYIERGEKPSVFKVEKNGKEVEIEGDSREFQKRLEEEILQFDIKSFTRLICLGYNYIRFFELSAPERREFIESVLDLEKLSEMTKQVKELQKNDSDNFTRYGLMLNGKKSNKEIYEKQLETLSQSNEELINGYKSKIVELTESNKDLNIKIVETNNKIDELKELRSNIEKDINELNSKNSKIQSEAVEINSFLSKNVSMLSFLKEHDECPTCKQVIDANFKDEQIKSLEKQNSGYRSKKSDLEVLYKSNSEVLSNYKNELNSSISDLNKYTSELSEYKANYKNNENTINENNTLIKKAENNSDIVETKNNLAEAIKDIEDFEQKMKKIELKLNVYKTTLDLLSETGVKKAIIDNYIDIINQKVNEYLEDFNCTFDFTMDNEFNETINLDFHDDVKYESLSAGQKQRLDLSIFLAFREIAQLRSKMSANLLLLDEIIDANIDNEGVLDLLKILKKQKLNILAISHNETVKEVVDNVITIKKEKYGFSRIVQ